MRLDLHDIIERPGGRVPFSCELEAERVAFPSLESFTELPRAEGEVVNSAGLLTLRGRMTAAMNCLCDRCARSFELRREWPLELTLADDPEDTEDPDVFPLEGDELDLSGVLETFFILNMDTKFLCRPDCAGLCERCGANLNDGPCSCKAQTDPRLAVLEQLLDDRT